MVGAEILKHALINDKKFFNWLKINTKYIFSQKKINCYMPLKKVVESNFLLLRKM